MSDHTALLWVFTMHCLTFIMAVVARGAARKKEKEQDAVIKKLFEAVQKREEEEHPLVTVTCVKMNEQ